MQEADLNHQKGREARAAQDGGRYHRRYGRAVNSNELGDGAGDAEQGEDNKEEPAAITTKAMLPADNDRDKEGEEEEDERSYGEAAAVVDHIE